LKQYKRRVGMGMGGVAGAAAVLIGGTTLHAFAGVGLGKEDAATLVKKVYANKLTSARWQRARALIIDEVSMIDAELFDKIDYVARQLKTPGKPFGGARPLSTRARTLPPLGALACHVTLSLLLSKMVDDGMWMTWCLVHCFAVLSCPFLAFSLAASFS
jgi:hypothetical protein